MHVEQHAAGAKKSILVDPSLKHGVVPNKASVRQVVNSDESTLAHWLGAIVSSIAANYSSVGFHPDMNLKKLEYNKIILSDTF
jgi:hypothetical protein